MKLIQYIIFLLAITQLNGCIITSLFTISAFQKRKVYPSLYRDNVTVYSNKDKTQYKIKFSGQSTYTKKDYVLTIKKKTILKKIPKKISNKTFDLKQFKDKRIEYQNIKGKDLYKINYFKRKRFKKINKDKFKVQKPFKYVEPTMIFYTDLKKNIAEEKALAILSKKKPVVIICYKNKNGDISDPIIYMKMNLHRDKKDEYIKTDLIHYKSRLTNIAALIILLPVSLTLDVITSPFVLLSVTGYLFQKMAGK